VGDRLRQFRILLWLWLAFAVSGPSAAWSQTPTAETAGESAALQQLRDAKTPLSEAAIRDLIARLDDQEVRTLLLERLDAQALPAAAAGTDIGALLAQWRHSADLFRQNFGAMLQDVPQIPAGMSTAFRQLPEQGSATMLFWLVFGFAMMLLAGWAAEWIARKLLRKIWQQAVDPDSETHLSRVGRLTMRLLLEIAFLLAFVAGALLLFFILWQGNEVTRMIVMTYMTAVIAVRFFMIFSRFLLAPSKPHMRLVHMSDADTHMLHRQNIVMASIAAFGFLTCSLLQHLGMPENAHKALVFSVGFVLFATLVWTIIRARKAISGDLTWDANRQGRIKLLLTEIWPGITASFVVLLYVVIALLVFTGTPVSYLSVFGSLLTVIFVPHIDAVFERAAQRLEARKESEDTTGDQFHIVAYRAARIALYIVSALFLMRIWGVDLFNLAQRSVGSRIADALVDIGLTALVAYVLWEMARIAIDRRLAAEGGGAEEASAEPGEQGGQGVSRIRTLLPLMRGTVQVTIAAMAVMLILSSLGVDIGPLLAGAGVVGLAVGFGAQTLVRDIVSGVFFLVDDAFRLGEYIDVGVVKGTVEKISIRSLRLRHHRGALHTVPFGEIQHLTNYSRDWAIMKLEFRVPFDTDLEKVRKIFKRIGQDLMQDEELGPDFLQPFKSQGVLATDDSAFVLRGKFMAKPGRQFLIRRAVFTAVQRAFAEQGIKFADRRVTVTVPGAESMEPEDRAAAEKAAAAVAAQAQNAAPEAKA
jgi:moderate conductance mechanosensitive channel